MHPTIKDKFLFMENSHRKTKVKSLCQNEWMTEQRWRRQNPVQQWLLRNVISLSFYPSCGNYKVMLFSSQIIYVPLRHNSSKYKMCSDDDDEDDEQHKNTVTLFSYSSTCCSCHCSIFSKIRFTTWEHSYRTSTLLHFYNSDLSAIHYYCRQTMAYNKISISMQWVGYMQQFIHKYKHED